MSTKGKSLVVCALLAVLTVLAGILACRPTGSPSGAYTIKTFEFRPSHPPQSVGESTPHVWIDTNTKLSGLFGGTVTSSLPCAVMIDYTDNSFTFKSAEFTSVKITYDDGAVGPATEAVKLPLRLAAREYTSVNSVAGGRIVESKTSLISGKIPEVVTRAEPFRLQLEGHFIKNDGSTLPFIIDQHFDVERENAVKSAAEVLQDK